jgi:hypothetical protein
MAVAEGDVAELQLLAADSGAAAVPVVIGGIEQVLDRHLEGVLNLPGVQQQLEVRLHEGHHRRDAKAGVHEVVRQVTDYRHEALGETDLLTRFAQCRRDRAAVGALDAPARETDLAGVIAQPGRALREEHRELAPFDQRHEHRGRHRVLRKEAPLRLLNGFKQAG